MRGEDTINIFIGLVFFDHGPNHPALWVDWIRGLPAITEKDPGKGIPRRRDKSPQASGRNAEPANVCQKSFF
jgi:hypothetical protein